MDELTDTTLLVHRMLTESGVEHALCGGLAANLYRANARATDDVDFYIIVSAPHLVEVARTFERAGWQAHPHWRGGELLRLDHAEFPRVDCLIAATESERQAVQRAVVAEIAGEDVPVLRPEDLIVFKLVAGRFQDYEAVAAMINTNAGALDERFIVDELTELDMSDRWDRAKEGAELEAQDRG